MDKSVAAHSDARSDDRQLGQTLAGVRPKEMGHRRFRYGAYDRVGAQEESTVALCGRIVVDPQHAKVGTVTDVLFDDRAASRWAVVKTGALSGEHLMPLADAYVDTDGRVVSWLNKTAVKHAPRVGTDHVLTAARRFALRNHYGTAA